MPNPNRHATNVVTVADVEYGTPGAYLRTDVYLPPLTFTGTLPGIVFPAFSRFRFSDRKDPEHKGLAGDLAALGYVVYLSSVRTWHPDYGGSGSGTGWTMSFDDLKTLVTWIRANAGTYDTDGTRLGGFGGSGGAYLIARLATDGTGGWTTGTRIKAVACWSGPMNVAEVAVQQGVSGDPQQPWIDFTGCDPLDGDPTCITEAREASPYDQADATDPPFFIAHSDAETIPVEHATDMDAKLDSLGVTNDVRIYAGTEHGLGLERLAFSATANFFNNHLTPPSAQFRNITGNSDGTDATRYQTEPFTPVAGEALLAGIWATVSAGSPTRPTSVKEGSRDWAIAHNTEGEVIAGTRALWAYGASGAGDQLSPSFDGTDDFITMGDPASGVLDFGLGDFTVSFWFRDTGGLGVVRQLVTKKASNGTAAGWRINLNAANGVSFEQADGTTATVTSTGVQAQLRDGNWHHIRLVRRGATNEVLFAFDGVALAPVAATARNVSSATALFVGKIASTQFAKGNVRDLRIYNAEVDDSSTRSQQLLGTEANLAGYWRLDEGTGTVATDWTSNANNGTLTGATWEETCPTMAHRLVVTFGGTHTSCGWGLAGISGSNPDSPYAEVKKGQANTTDLIITLAAVPSSKSSVFGIFGAPVSVITPGTGFAGLHDVSIAAPQGLLRTEWQAGSDQTVNATIGAANQMYGIAIALSEEPPEQPAITAGALILLRRPNPDAAPQVAWSLDGEPVELEGAQWSAAEGGWHTANGTLQGKDARRVKRESVLRAVVEGIVKWEGIILDPPLVHGGKAEIRAVGNKMWAERAHGELLYQTRDYGLWQDASDPPFEFGDYDHPDFTAEVREAALHWRVQKEEKILVPSKAHGLLLSLPGVLGGIARVAGKRLSVNMGNLETRLSKFSGSDSTTIVSVAGNLGTSDATTFDQTIGTPLDGVMLDLRNTADINVALDSKDLRIVNLRANGIAPGDDFKTSEVVEDLCDRLGYDIAGVQASGLNALPFHLIDGSWLEAGFLEMALLDDWVVNILDTEGGRHRGRCLYGPKGERVWEVLLGKNATPDLRELAPYGGVRVFYDALNGARKAATAGEEPFYEEFLSDAQHNGDLAKAVADILLPVVTVPRYEGQLTFVDARDPAGRSDLFGPLPGDHFRVVDWGPAESKLLPVTELEWSAREGRAGINMPASAARVLALAELRSSRRRWQRKPKKARK